MYCHSSLFKILKKITKVKSGFRNAVFFNKGEVLWKTEFTKKNKLLDKLCIRVSNKENVLKDFLFWKGKMFYLLMPRIKLWSKTFFDYANPYLSQIVNFIKYDMWSIIYLYYEFINLVFTCHTPNWVELHYVHIWFFCRKRNFLFWGIFKTNFYMKG